MPGERTIYTLFVKGSNKISNRDISCKYIAYFTVAISHQKKEQKNQLGLFTLFLFGKIFKIKRCCLKN